MASAACPPLSPGTMRGTTCRSWPHKGRQIPVEDCVDQGCLLLAEPSQPPLQLLPQLIRHCSVVTIAFQDFSQQVVKSIPVSGKLSFFADGQGFEGLGLHELIQDFRAEALPVPRHRCQMQQAARFHPCREVCSRQGGRQTARAHPSMSRLAADRDSLAVPQGEAEEQFGVLMLPQTCVERTGFAQQVAGQQHGAGQEGIARCRPRHQVVGGTVLPAGRGFEEAQPLAPFVFSNPRLPGA